MGLCADVSITRVRVKKHFVTKLVEASNIR